MKILVAGDTHGNQGHLRYLIRMANAHDCSRIFVVGDFGYWEHTREGREFLDEVNHYALNQAMLVYFCDGNHDKTSLLVDKYQEVSDHEGFLKVRDFIRYASRGHRWDWGGLRFIALGGAYSIDKGWRLAMEKQHPGKYPLESLWFPEEEMSDEDMDAILKDTSPVDIIMAHDMPRGSDPGWGRDSPQECHHNQDRLARAVRVLDPKLYFHGHLHYPYRFDLWHVHEITRDMHVTKVIGLDCDGNAGEDKMKSWIIFDTEEVASAKQEVSAS